jgi:hypothetical protein
MGSLDLINVDAWNNAGPPSGSNVAGGVVNVQGGGYLRIANSRFWNNQCNGGGAIGVLNQMHNYVYNSWFFNNTAQSGNGGAIYLDGTHDFQACGSVLVANTAPTSQGNGGAFFRTTDDPAGSQVPANSTFILCLFDRNSAGNVAGPLYSQGGQPVVQNSVFTRNTAGYAGGLYLSFGSNTATVQDVSFIDNYSKASGAAAALDTDNPSTGVLDHLTVAQNNEFYGPNGALEGQAIHFQTLFSLMTAAHLIIVLYNLEMEEIIRYNRYVPNPLQSNVQLLLL